MSSDRGASPDHMLDNARVATRLPAQDLDRARRFYSDKLGLLLGLGEPLR
jgi:hypothetical protein